MWGPCGKTFGRMLVPVYDHRFHHSLRQHMYVCGVSKLGIRGQGSGLDAGTRSMDCLVSGHGRDDGVVGSVGGGRRKTQSIEKELTYRTYCKKVLILV